VKYVEDFKNLYSVVSYRHDGSRRVVDTVGTSDKRQLVTLNCHSELGTNTPIHREGHSGLQVGRHVERQWDHWRERYGGNDLFKRTLYSSGRSPISVLGHRVRDQHSRQFRIR